MVVRRWPGRRVHWPAIPSSAEEQITSHDEQGLKQRSEFWLNDELVGVVLWDQGRPSIATSLRAGRVHGSLIEYDDGRISYLEPYVDGLQHGWAQQFKADGRLLIACPFSNGNGTDYWCNNDGMLVEEHPFVAGKPSGLERWWASDKALYEETHWLDGRWHGPRRYWRHGRLERGFPRFFYRGRRVSKRVYLEAQSKDSSLPPYRPQDDLAERTLPREFFRLRARARRLKAARA